MSKIIQIKTPATSANLGPGFDFLGIALSLYNVFEFEETNAEEKEIGFEGVGENLVKICFQKLVQKYSEKPIHVNIKLVENNIPVARGLGSSSSAIVSGCVAANYFMKNRLSEQELIQEMVAIEGHPDNVLPCYFGGMVSSIVDTQLHYYKHSVSSELFFHCLIPSYQVKTEQARAILPKEYSLKDVTNNASRAFMLSHAMVTGDIDLIKLATKDSIHEPYRKTLIKEWNLLEHKMENEEAKLNISGSGPTMLLISKKKDVIEKVKAMNLDLIIHTLSVSKIGYELIEKE